MIDRNEGELLNLAQFYLAMIIPDNLSPLPVMPPTGETAETQAPSESEFVSESTIRQLLIGPMMVTPLVTARVPEGHGFAGRDDLESQDAPAFVTLSSDEAYDEEPAKEFQPEGPHPALAEPKHAAPPRPRIETEGRLPDRHASDRWWVLGMGVALLAIVGSSALIELISSEALRRASLSPGAESVELPPVILPAGPQDKGTPSLVASHPEYPAP